MAERIQVILKTPEGDRSVTTDQATLDRLALQQEMLKEYGSDPMFESEDGEYHIVQGVVVLKQVK